MRLGVLILPERRWTAEDEQGRWRRAEQLGFDHAWTYDHLAWRGLHDEPWFAAVPTLAAAAVVTSSIRLGPLVASPNFRHPVPFARELVTLDDLAGGRLTVGLGAGGHGWDATILGQEPWSRRQRADRFVEFTELLDQLLRQPVTTSAGPHYRAERAPTVPGCVQQPRVPFAIAATGRRGMRLAARVATTWVTTGGPEPDGALLGPEAGAAVVAEQLAHLEDACRAEGRHPGTLDRLVLTGLSLDPGLRSAAAFRETVAAYEAVGVTDLVVHWPRPSGPFAGDEAALDRIMA